MKKGLVRLLARLGKALGKSKNVATIDCTQCNMKPYCPEHTPTIKPPASMHYGCLIYDPATRKGTI